MSYPTKRRKKALKPVVAEVTDPWAPAETVLAIRTCRPDGSSSSDRKFRYDLTPGSVTVAPDWNTTPVCGGGLHVLVDAQGDWGLLDWSVDAVALIVRVRKDELVAIDAAKSKVPRLRVERVTTLGQALCEIACDEATINRVVERVLVEAQKSGEKPASGYGAQLAASGDGAQLAASGDGAKLAASGYGAQLAASGDGAKLAASGYGAKLAASGYGAQLAASGDGAKLAASGDGAQLAASGDGAKLAASGDDAQLAASGDGAKLAASGYGALILGAHRATAKAGAGGCIALAWWDEKARRPRVSVGYVGDALKPDTWYCVDDLGEFVKGAP
jgi:hypothetical protein